MANHDELSFETQLVHAGERADLQDVRSVATPIYTTTTFTYERMADFESVFAGEKAGYLYTRFGNPTVTALEKALTILEGGAGTVAYSSGMAALHAAVLASDVKPGACILASQDLYGATFSLLDTVFGAFDVKTASVDFNDTEALTRAIDEHRPRVLIAETISNPLLKICPLSQVAHLAHKANARLIVDNTFASPYLAQPLKHNADFVVHSATKYLSGHGDSTGGAVTARDSDDLPALIKTMKLVGGVLSVWDAHEIMRGIKTLAVRLERQCANAHRIASHLAKHEAVSQVFYPLLNSTAKSAATAKVNHDSFSMPVLRQGFGGALVTIRLREDSRAAAFRFMDALNLCVRSTSLGDVFTGVIHPPTASHRDLTNAERARFGITDGTIRISVGIENADDIIADLEQALKK